MRIRHWRGMVVVLPAALVGLLSGAAAPAQAERGLVAHYTFAKADSAVIPDESGCGNDARICGGARLTMGESGPAVQFDGKDGYVDCGAKASLDISRGGSVLLWFKPSDYPRGGLAAWSAGPDKQGRRIVLSLNTIRESRSRGVLEYRELGFYISNGEEFDTPFGSNFHEPYFPPSGEWLFYAVTFNGRQVDIYRDGALVMTRFQSLIPDVKDVPLWLGRCAGAGGPSDYFRGLMSDVRVYNRAIDEREVYQVYMQTAAGRDKATDSFGSIGIKPQSCPRPGTIFADLDYRGLPPTSAALGLRAELLDAKGNVVAAGRINMLPAWGRAEVTFDVRTQPAGNYTIRATADKSRPASAGVAWPGRAKGWENIVVLNNFCWELLNESPIAKAQKEYTFSNPRRGWVYVLAEADGDVTLSLVGAKPPVSYAPGTGATQEAMRWMGEGTQTISVAGNGVLKKLVVRAIPILFFAHYPHVGPGTATDHDFLAKYVLPHVNTLDTGDYDATYNPNDFRSKWVNEMGRQCVQELYTRSLLQPELKKETALQQIYDHMAKAAGMNKPDFAGVILDEFDPGDDTMAWYPSYYDEWIEAGTKVLIDPKFAGRMVIPWFGYNMFDFKKSSAFLQNIVKHGSCIANEIYVDERDSESRAWLFMNEAMADVQDDMERAVPGATGKTIVTPSYLPREYWNPQVDFKVYMDMQYQHLATRPEFFGLMGVGEYQSHSSTEEYVRCAALLARHYGIDGRTERMLKDPYECGLIRNADFLDGTEGWTLQPAQKDSMAARSYKGYGLLEDRFPYRPWTDTTFLWTKRSAEKPNVFSQTVKNLQPGRLYLVKVWIGDYAELITGDSKDAERAVSIRVDNAERWGNVYQSQLMKGNVYTFAAYQAQPFSYQNRYYIKVHHLVFRAAAPTATLSISDWKGEKEPGGPAGQELIFNNIMVEPYLEP